MERFEHSNSLGNRGKNRDKFVENERKVEILGQKQPGDCIENSPDKLPGRITI